MVWRTGLLIKLKRFGINSHMLTGLQISSMNNQYKCALGRHCPAVDNLTAQGSIISPESFLGLIDDVPD